MKAEDLIKQKTKPTITMPGKAALAELKAVLAYNEGKATSLRIGAKATLAMLATHGCALSVPALDKVCQALGRKSYSTP